MNQPVTLAEAAVPVREYWAAQYAAGVIRSSTAQLYERHLDTFIRFAAASEDHTGFAPQRPQRITTSLRTY